MVLALTADILPSSFFDAPDGRISLTPEGGSSPYTYVWSTGDTTAEIVVPAGIYTVTVTDASALTITEVYTVTQPLKFDLRINPYTVGLLSDTIIRDLYCRKVIGEGNQIIGRGKAAQSFYIRSSGASYDTIGTVIGGKEPDGSGGLTLSVYEQTTPYDVVHITKEGVSILGNLTISGSTTEVVVNDIKVQDHTISLSAFESTAAGVDGSGMLIGTGAAQRSFLYSSTADAFAFDASVYVQGSGNIRIGDSWANAPTVLTKDSFSVSHGVPGIKLDGTGLTLTNCLLVDPIPTTDHVISDHGITHLATGKFFGWDSIDSIWSTSGDDMRANSFKADGATFSSAGLSVPISNSADTVRMNSTGFNVGSAVSLTQEGLGLVSNDACIYFGNRAWRLIYDATENALVFEKFQDGGYVVKLTLD
jgi:hypothetical protein